jgi:hypothetical protein
MESLRAFALAGLSGLLLVAPACAEIGIDGEATDDDGREEAGSGSPDAGPPVDRPATGGSEPACNHAAGGTSGKMLRVVYVVPSDRQVNPRYLANLESSVRHLQLWLRDQIPASTSFRIHEPIVEVVKTEHPASYYATNANGDNPDLYYWNNATADALAGAGGSFGDPDNIWMLYVDADPACGQATLASSHVALLPANDLRGLAGDAREPICPGESVSYGRCRWVGGMATMLSYALGVPRPAGCTDADPATECNPKLITQLGYLSYPDAVFSDTQVDYLRASGFVDGSGLPDCELDCSLVARP